MSLNSISKGSKNFEYSRFFGGTAKLKPLHRTIFHDHLSYSLNNQI